MLAAFFSGVNRMQILIKDNNKPIAVLYWGSTAVRKYNHHHDKLGRFASADGSSGDYIEEQGLRNKHGSNSVKWDVVKSKEYTKKFLAITDNEYVATQIAKFARKALLNRDGTETEEMYALDINNGRLITKVTDQNEIRRVGRTDRFKKLLNIAESNNTNILIIHNHPDSSVPSLADINALLDNERAAGITVGHNGNVYYYTKPESQIKAMDFSIAFMKTKAYNIVDESMRREEVLGYLSKKFKFRFEKL